MKYDFHDVFIISDLGKNTSYFFDVNFGCWVLILNIASNSRQTYV